MTDTPGGGGKGSNRTTPGEKEGEGEVGGEAKQAGERALKTSRMQGRIPLSLFVQETSTVLVCIVFPFLSFLMFKVSCLFSCLLPSCWSRACSLCLFSVIEVTNVGYFCGGIQYRTNRNLGDFYPSVLLVAYLYSTPWWGWEDRYATSREMLLITSKLM